MPQGTLDLYTDASIKGETWTRQLHGGQMKWHRSRRGPAMVGWIGWHDCDPSTRPNLAGQAYVGPRGTQSGEYQARLHGLHAAVAYVRTAPVQPERVVVHIDNEHVHLQMTGKRAVDAMKSHFDAAMDAVAALEQLGIDMYLQQVPETHGEHKKAHQMSRNA